ncbi:MAG: hypothetical protein LBL06_05840 [Treponema sp.]|nr:hypothetical protein [Treponema sp.]
MALSVSSAVRLQDYFKGVVERANHHALNVLDIIYPLLGFIILYFDPDSDIEVREYNGGPANMLWIHINGKRYTFRYDHEKDNIEIRDNNAKGVVLHEIDNDTTIADLKMIFQSLKERQE